MIDAFQRALERVIRFQTVTLLVKSMQRVRGSLFYHSALFSHTVLYRKVLGKVVQTVCQGNTSGCQIYHVERPDYYNLNDKMSPWDRVISARVWY